LDGYGSYNRSEGTIYARECYEYGLAKGTQFAYSKRIQGVSAFAKTSAGHHLCVRGKLVTAEGERVGWIWIIRERVRRYDLCGGVL
jgi:hypothetical protein